MGFLKYSFHKRELFVARTKIGQEEKMKKLLVSLILVIGWVLLGEMAKGEEYIDQTL